MDAPLVNSSIEQANGEQIQAEIIFVKRKKMPYWLAATSTMFCLIFTIILNLCGFILLALGIYLYFNNESFWDLLHGPPAPSPPPPIIYPPTETKERIKVAQK
eukprot:TRINITY_DN74274_c0_g2_i1.p3 TRINITY_DN74274_c0_g2~~TRINITY_DN74274_c0_g2_i1.p3  ORF type:complete len:103 (+),score=9.66 TRINITY_DN74274_c0_g2_i1:180-488(+)